MSDTTAAVQNSTMAALNSDSAAALITAAASAAASAAAAAHTHSTSTSNVNIKALIPITLDMQSTCYRRWKNLFRIVLGRYALSSHVDSDASLPDDPPWVQADLTVVMWLHATLGDDLMDMVMADNPSAHSVWTKIENFFNANKPSRAVHIEAQLHAFEQGDLPVSEFCRQLKNFANQLADCDEPLTERALVHQLIRGIDKRFATLKTMLPALPTFPTFNEARDHLLREERSLGKPASSASTESALAVSESSTGSTDSGARSDGGARGNASGSPSNRGGRGGSGRGNGGGRGWRGGRGRGGGRGSNQGGRGGQQPAWIPYYPQWNGAAWNAPGAPWRAPWTGATGPGVLGTRPPSNAGQAYPAFAAPATMSAPLATSSWDTSGLIAALQAASTQQPSPNGGWYFDTGASSHMTGDQGSTHQENSHDIQ